MFLFFEIANFNPNTGKMNVSILQTFPSHGRTTDSGISSRCMGANEITTTSIALMRNLFTSEAASIGEVVVAIMIAVTTINLISNMITVATIATSMMVHRAASAAVVVDVTLSLTTSAMNSALNKSVLNLGMTSKKDLTAAALDLAMIALTEG